MRRQLVGPAVRHPFEARHFREGGIDTLLDIGRIANRLQVKRAAGVGKKEDRLISPQPPPRRTHGLDTLVHPSQPILALLAGSKKLCRLCRGTHWKRSAFDAIAEFLEFLDHSSGAGTLGLGAHGRAPLLVADPLAKN